ncbi:arylsulfatase A family protein [Opitutaceae bacterium TAV1]|nr:arylsulfatase A family protein [Opitutaceae bacterium TAV1]
MSSSPSTPATRSFSRRAFLKSCATAGAIAAGRPLVNLFVPSAHADDVPVPPATAGMNLILFLTDQERALQWFPAGWAAANLPAYTSLCANGVSFERACANTCMCTPSRNTIFTGLFPAQHRSPDTLTEGFPQSATEHQLDPALPNLATTLKAAGYEVVYKGKWHLSKGVEGADEILQNDDISRYGFDQWDAPDAGQDVQPANFGGGTADHDTRFINDAIAYLRHKRDNPGGKPFCLVVSLVNPHDVLGYPGNYLDGGYTNADLVGDIDLPPTVDENLLLNHKPTAHVQLGVLLNGLGPLPGDIQKRAYLNFYGNLMKRVDAHLRSLLDVFSANSAGEALRSRTLVVRTSDHGEMGMCHGGLRQKSFMCYEEVIRVPLVWSNPDLFPAGRVSPHLVSHVDLLPTICSLLGVPDWQSYPFAGVDYSSMILDPDAPAVQDYVLFTYDDIYAGQSADGTDGNGIVSAPNRIRMIREAGYKYALYYDGLGAAADQQEFYDLRPAALGGTDIDGSTGQPVELRNLSVWAEGLRTLAGQSTLATPGQIIERTRMMQRLDDVAAERLQPRSWAAPVKAENVTIRTVAVTDEGAGATTDMIELKFISRWGSNYQLQKSSDLTSWVDTGEPIPGTNGPILLSEPLGATAMFYRLVATAAS